MKVLEGCSQHGTCGAEGARGLLTAWHHVEEMKMLKGCYRTGEDEIVLYAIGSGDDKLYRAPPTTLFPG